MLRSGEAVPLDPRAVEGWEALEPGLGLVFQVQRNRREGVAVLELSLRFHLNVFLLLFQSF